MRHDAYMSLVNDIYDRMLRAGVRPQALFDLSLEVIPDTQADSVWRDYCAQKLKETLTREDVSTGSRQQGFALLDALTGGAYPEMQGTGLLVAGALLEQPLSDVPAFLNKDTLGERAVACAQNAQAPLIDRITALQAAALFEAPGALEVAISLQASDGSEPVMLQVSALAAIGTLGGSEHRALLERHRLSPDIRLRKAARSALSRIAENS